MKIRRWAAAVSVVLAVAFVGPVMAAGELEQTFATAKKNGENLVDVVKAALQAGATMQDVAQAAKAAGIGSDVVTAAALAAGLEADEVARAVDAGMGRDLGYVAPETPVEAAAGGEMSAATTGLPGAGAEHRLQGSEVGSLGGTQSGLPDQGNPGPCPEHKKCQYASGEWCCETASTDYIKCRDGYKCK